MRRLNYSAKGQSLLETVFAIGILVAVVSAILALSTSAIHSQQESESQIIANNLAREGIEIVRNTRDSNWLSGQAWDTGLVDISGNNSNQAIAKFIPANSPNDWQLDFDLVTNKDLIYLSPDGVYSQQSGNNQPTIFSRRLIFDNICRDAASGLEELTSLPCADKVKVGIKAVCKVSWTERGGRQRFVNLQDLLYDWK